MSSYERHKVCMDCKEIKPISGFAYGFGSYRKSDKCRECKQEKTRWNFGGSVRATTKESRVCKSSTYFDKKTTSLNRLNDQVRMINSRDYIETEKSE